MIIPNIVKKINTTNTLLSTTIIKQVENEYKQCVKFDENEPSVFHIEYRKVLYCIMFDKTGVIFVEIYDERFNDVLEAVLITDEKNLLVYTTSEPTSQLTNITNVPKINKNLVKQIINRTVKGIQQHLGTFGKTTIIKGKF